MNKSDQCKAFFSERYINLKEEWLSAVIKFIISRNLDVTDEVKLTTFIFEQWKFSSLADTTIPFFKSKMLKKEVRRRILTFPFVCQINSIIDIGSSFYSQYSRLSSTSKIDNTGFDAIFEEKDKDNDQKSARMLKLEVTDGETELTAIELYRIPELSLYIKPGCKILLIPPFEIRQGCFLLKPENCQILGGECLPLLNKNRPLDVYIQKLNISDKVNEQPQVKHNTVPTKSPVVRNPPRPPEEPTIAELEMMDEIMGDFMMQEDIEQMERQTPRCSTPVRHPEHRRPPVRSNDVMMHDDFDQVESRRSSMPIRSSESRRTPVRSNELMMQDDFDQVESRQSTMSTRNPEPSRPPVRSDDFDPMDSRRCSTSSRVPEPKRPPVRSNDYIMHDDYGQVEPRRSTINSEQRRPPVKPDDFMMQSDYDQMEPRRCSTSTRNLEHRRPTVKTKASVDANFDDNFDDFAVTASMVAKDRLASEENEFTNLPKRRKVEPAPAAGGIKRFCVQMESKPRETKRRDPEEYVLSALEEPIDIKKIKKEKAEVEVVDLDDTISPVKPPETKSLVSPADSTMEAKDINTREPDPPPPPVKPEDPIITRYKELKIERIFDVIKKMKYSVNIKKSINVMAVVTKEIDALRIVDGLWTMKIRIRDDSGSIECLIDNDTLYNMIGLTCDEAMVIKKSTDAERKKDGKQRLLSVHRQLMRLDLVFSTDFFNTTAVVRTIRTLAEAVDAL